MRRPHATGCSSLPRLAALACAASFSVCASPGLVAAPASARAPAECVTDAFRKFAFHAGAHVDVWYDPNVRGDAADAARISREIEGRIWGSFASLLGRVPPADDGEACFHGPDGKLDVYLTRARRIGELSLPKDVVAVTHPFNSEQCAPRQPVYVIAPPGSARGVIAHELFHAFQAAYGRAQRCFFYSQWEEATATWAADHVYPRDNIEHNHPEAIERPDVAVDFWGYGTWAFIYYLTKTLNSPTIVRRIEEAGEVLPDTAHVDESIPGGFKQRFPEFALYAWNQSPLPRTDKIKDSFRQWDGIPNVPHPHKRPVKPRTLSLGNARDKTDPWRAHLVPLGRDYRHYVVADNKIRLVRFENPHHGDPFSVSAFVRLAHGGWRVQTWSGRDEVEFCRDYRDEDVRELIIAASNTSYNDALTVQPKLEVRDRCTTKAILRIHGADGLTITDPACGVDTRANADWQAEVEFELPPRFGHRVDDINNIAGTATGNVNSQTFLCTDAQSARGPVAWNGAGNDDVRLKITPTSSGAHVTLDNTPMLEGAGVGWGSPYFVLDASTDPNWCEGPNGNITTAQLRSRHATVTLSGSCDRTVVSGGETYHGIATAKGTLEIRRGT